MGQIPLGGDDTVVSQPVCRDFARSSRLEWLETDGQGGFAMGTVAQVNTRRYHGVLVPALTPPVGRHVLLSRLEEAVGSVELGAAQYPGVVTGRGFERLTSFRPSPFPTWHFQLEGVELEKQLFMVRGAATTVVTYRASAPVTLTVKPLLAYRDFHALARANGFLDGRLTVSPGAVRVQPYQGLPPLTLFHSGSASAAGSGWYHAAEYLGELDRGLDFREDLYCLGTLELTVEPGQTAFVVATIDGGAWDGAAVAAAEAAERARRVYPAASPELSRLHAAAEHFVVQRRDGSPTVIAGYPWFADWGRDTMISLPGLFISRGRFAEAEAVLRGFLAHLDKGLIPNRFPDGGEAPEYNTVDATLWMFHAVSELARASADRRFATGEFFPLAREILRWHHHGTHHGVRVDPADGLLVAGEPGTQLTWMDARVGDRVVTPRHGKPVEVNALFYNALMVTAGLAREVGHEDAPVLEATAGRVKASFLAAFWDGATGTLADVVWPGAADRRVRPNQLLAVSLPHSMLSGAQMRAVVDAVERELLTPVGLRTLQRGVEGYQPTYGGDPAARDGAYHQGTVWPWLMGPFVTAYLRAFGRSLKTVDYCRTLVERLLLHLDEAVVGSVSEVFDAEYPHRPGGAPAQAWSVAELLRLLLDELSVNQTFSRSEPTP